MRQKWFHLLLFFFVWSKKGWLLALWSISIASAEHLAGFQVFRFKSQIDFLDLISDMSSILKLFIEHLLRALFYM